MTDEEKSKRRILTKERIEILKLEIAQREEELEFLSNKLIDEETDIHKKFVIWANNGLDKETQGSLPSGAIRKWCDKHLDLGSMRGSVHLLEHDDSFGLFSLTEAEIEDQFDGSMIDVIKKDIEKLKNDVLFIEACEQMIQEDMDGFEIDW